MTQRSFTDPPEDQPPRNWRDPTVREREAAAKAMEESRRLLIAAGAKGVRAVDEEGEPRHPECHEGGGF